MVHLEQQGSVKKLFSTIWWLVLLRGLVILLMGLLLIFRPVPTITVLFYLLGFYWFFDGVFTLIKSIRARKSHKDWGRGVFVGIISMLAGVIVFINPYIGLFISAILLIYFVAFLALVSGIWSFITGVKLRKSISNEWSMILGGTLSVLFGILLMVNPIVSAITLVWLMGIFALIGGIGFIVLSFRLKAAAK
jgi:uncharacterized membrane protein HdeD (DUF308 family)